MQIHILGTSSSRPAHGRSVSGSAINTEKGIIIVDCGEGFQERITLHNKRLKLDNPELKIKVGRINTILLTHGHLDHTWGLLPFLKTLSLDGREKSLTIIAPTSHEIVNKILNSNNPFVDISDLEPANVDLCLQFRQWWSLGGTSDLLNFQTNWILIGANQDDNIGHLNAILIDPDNNSVQPVKNLEQYTNNIEILHIPTLHSVPSCGWWIKEENKKGKFNSNLASSKKLNIKQIQQLAKGEDIEGHASKDYILPEQIGSSVLISGDTAGKNNGFINFSKSNFDTTLLIHEATFMEEHLNKANEFLHSTGIQAAQNAKLINAKHLVITHYSSRIKNTDSLKLEAANEFGIVHAASDSDIINLTHDDIKIISQS